MFLYIVMIIIQIKSHVFLYLKWLLIVIRFFLIKKFVYCYIIPKWTSLRFKYIFCKEAFLEAFITNEFNFFTNIYINFGNKPDCIFGKFENFLRNLAAYACSKTQICFMTKMFMNFWNFIIQTYLKPSSRRRTWEIH